MTRIRYKNVDGVLVSPEFESPNGPLVAKIYSNGNFGIINMNNGGETREVDTRTLQAAKKLVKSALKSLGVVFTDEVRPRINSFEEYKNEVLSDLEHDQ